MFCHERRVIPYAPRSHLIVSLTVSVVSNGGVDVPIGALAGKLPRQPGFP